MVNSVVSTVVSSQAIAVTIAIRISTITTIVTSIVVGGIGISFGISIGITTLAGTGDRDIGSINTGSTLDSIAIGAVGSGITIISSIGTIVAKTVVATITGISSQTIAIAIMTIGMISVSIKNSGVSLGLSLSFGVDGSHEQGDNCNKGLPH